MVANFINILDVIFCPTIYILYLDVMNFTSRHTTFSIFLLPNKQEITYSPEEA